MRKKYGSSHDEDFWFSWYGFSRFSFLLILRSALVESVVGSVVTSLLLLLGCVALIVLVFVAVVVVRRSLWWSACLLGKEWVFCELIFLISFLQDSHTPIFGPGEADAHTPPPGELPIVRDPGHWPRICCCCDCYYVVVMVAVVLVVFIVGACCLWSLMFLVLLLVVVAGVFVLPLLFLFYCVVAAAAAAFCPGSRCSSVVLFAFKPSCESCCGEYWKGSRLEDR